MRRQNEVDQLLPYVKQIKYFADKPEIKENDYIFICEHARYEMVPQNKNVINVGKQGFAFLYCKGEYGDKFYVILEGQVSVLVPQKVKKVAQEES